MHPLHAATFAAKDLDRSVSDYTQLLDYTAIETGRLSKSLAGFWQIPDDAGGPYAVLGPKNGADGGLVRLIERPAAPRLRPFQHYGWCGVEFVVEDVLALQKRLQDADIEILMDPKPPWAPMAAVGPNGEGWLFNTPAENNPFHYTVLPARSFVDRISIIVCACKDRQASESFYADLLNAKPGHRAEMPLPFANRSMALPEDTAYKTGAMRFGRTPFVELDQYPQAKHPPEANFGTSLALATLNVASLDNIQVPLLAGPSVFEEDFYGGKRCALYRGPDGELLELLEHEST